MTEQLCKHCNNTGYLINDSIDMENNNNCPVTQEKIRCSFCTSFTPQSRDIPKQTNGTDCQCDFCKNHICNVNGHRCMDSRCENNSKSGDSNSAIEKAKEKFMEENEGVEVISPMFPPVKSSDEFKLIMFDKMLLPYLQIVADEKDKDFETALKEYQKVIDENFNLKVESSLKDKEIEHLKQECKKWEYYEATTSKQLLELANKEDKEIKEVKE